MEEGSDSNSLSRKDLKKALKKIIKESEEELTFKQIYKKAKKSLKPHKLRSRKDEMKTMVERITSKLKKSKDEKENKSKEEEDKPTSDHDEKPKKDESEEEIDLSDFMPPEKINLRTLAKESRKRKLVDPHSDDNVKRQKPHFEPVYIPDDIIEDFFAILDYDKEVDFLKPIKSQDGKSDLILLPIMEAAGKLKERAQETTKGGVMLKRHSWAKYERETGYYRGGYYDIKEEHVPKSGNAHAWNKGAKRLGLFTKREDRQLAQALMDAFQSRSIDYKEGMRILVATSFEIKARDKAQKGVHGIWKEVGEKVENRSLNQVMKHVKYRFAEALKTAWNEIDDSILLSAVAKYGNNWVRIATMLGRFWKDCLRRWEVLSIMERGIETTWDLDELIRLRVAVIKHSKDVNPGEKLPWKTIAEEVGTKTAEMCSAKYHSRGAVNPTFVNPNIQAFDNWNQDDDVKVLNFVWQQGAEDEGEIDWVNLKDEMGHFWNYSQLHLGWKKIRARVVETEPLQFDELLIEMAKATVIYWCEKPSNSKKEDKTEEKTDKPTKKRKSKKEAKESQEN